MAAIPETEHVIDLDEIWVSSLKKKVQVNSLRKHRHVGQRTIFRIPPIIRDSDPDAYEPKIISLGPFHNKKPTLKAMDNLKVRYLRKLLGRDTDIDLEDYLKLIKGVEPQARKSYSVEFHDISSNEFAEMMLLDSSFIVELLLMQFDRDNDQVAEEEDEEDPILSTSWALPLVEYDMLMLENQIPFSILESVFNLATDHQKSYPLIKLILAFFDELIPSDQIIVPSDETVPEFYHILHLFHSCIMPASQSKTKIYKLKKRKRLSTKLYSHLLSSLGINSTANRSLISLTPQSVPCAMKLRQAGVKFRNINAKSFLDINFEKGVMSIPTLHVYDQTNSLFRNLIAFEQCFPKAGMHVSTYAVLMDCLIDTAEDVALLHRYGCIVNGLGNDNDAASLFNQLCKEVAIDYPSCYLAGLFKDVNKHCDRRWNRWRAKLMHDYFSNPWSFLSLFGALVLIFLTVIQTGFAVVSYFRPPN